ncbi:hypothetical protein O181_039809 [Austropuccinia psidii MF-1]|uniref:Uncharacterized protein n=1 Tax=Austropuccinia psidii MF-1 TaxID=1389203 RepID=A0A9Q3HEW5_9BASI|nr:hypothetical protein [Austropuccinia psidii MF-1]
MKTTNRHILRLKKAIQEYRGNMNIIYKGGKSHKNAYGLSRSSLDNVKRNKDYYPEEADKLPIHFMEIDRKKKIRFSEWEPGSGTPDTNKSEKEETEAPILGNNFL